MLEHKTHFAQQAAQQVQQHTEAACEALQLGPEYGYVLIGVAVICFTCVMIGFMVPGRIRGQVFTKEFLKQFDQVHRSEFDSDITKSYGYPDMGNGVYGRQLPYKDWRRMNVAQRCHYHFIESLVPTVMFVLIGGLYYPIWAVSLSAATVVSRVLYCFYLSDKGAGHPLRITGALGQDLVLLFGLVLSIMSGLKFACQI